MDWESIIAALVALLGALGAIFGSHKRINKNVLTFLDEVIGHKAEIDRLLEELRELRDELRRQD